MFFRSEENTNILRDFLNKVKAVPRQNPEDPKRARIFLSAKIVEFIYNNPEEWDKRCTFNIKSIGDSFIKLLNNYSSELTGEIDKIYVFSYRFLCEFDFLVEEDLEPDMELKSILSTIRENNDELDDALRSQVIYATYMMPVSIAKDLISNSKIIAFKDFEKKIVEAENLKKEWNDEINSKKSATDKLKEKLTEYNVGFNFVGLNKGFSGLAEDKNKEAFLLFLALIVMGVFILTPLVLELLFTFTEDYRGITFESAEIIKLIPLISIEVILIYFFRIILMNHKSVKAQILQIELRKTLCQFIQSYSEYSAKIKKSDPDALEKFENIIFSGIISDPGRLPSTFDGFEQIGSFIKSMKNS